MTMDENERLKVTYKGRVRVDNPKEVVAQDISMEEDTQFISQYYLGQKIQDVLRGDLKRPHPNFSF
jgi:hypothetical protein